MIALARCGPGLFTSPFSSTARALPRAWFRASTVNMVAVGDKLPMAETLSAGGDQKTVEDLFSGKTVAVCAIPGALTPTCSEKHVPGFIQNAEALKSKGVDDIYVLAVNDFFVMKAFAKQLGAEDSGVTFLADGDASFASALGLTQNTGKFGGVRSQRYAMLAKDGVITSLNIDESGFEKSSAEELLKQL